MSGHDALAEERRRLTVEIFDVTGQKLGVDDPAVTAALFFSAKLQQAADSVTKAAQAVNQATDKATLALRQATEEAHQSVLKSVPAAVATASKVEAERARSDLASFAQDLKKRLRRGLEATITPAAADGKLLGRLVATIAVVAAAGVFVGAACFPVQKRLTLQEREQLTIGKTFIEIAPSLDSKTRQQIMSVLEKRSRSR